MATRQRWITWVWQGKAGRVIEELTRLVESVDPQSQESLQESLTYLDLVVHPRTADGPPPPLENAHDF